jgi:hypothetical protein
MSATLQSELLTDQNRHLLLDFDCGGALYAADVERTVRTLTPQLCAKSGITAWLFSTDEYPIVGVGSYSVVPIWSPDSAEATRQVLAGYIPVIALQRPFQHGPPGAPPNARYAARILRHIIAHAARDYLACDDPRRRPWLAAQVHEANVPARKFTARAGFVQFGEPALYEDGT